MPITKWKMRFITGRILTREGSDELNPFLVVKTNLLTCAEDSRIAYENGGFLHFSGRSAP